MDRGATLAVLSGRRRLTPKHDADDSVAEAEQPKGRAFIGLPFLSSSRFPFFFLVSDYLLLRFDMGAASVRLLEKQRRNAKQTELTQLYFAKGSLPLSLMFFSPSFPASFSGYLSFAHNLSLSRESFEALCSALWTLMATD